MARLTAKSSLFRNEEPPLHKTKRPLFGRRLDWLAEEFLSSRILKTMTKTAIANTAAIRKARLLTNLESPSSRLAYKISYYITPAHGTKETAPYFSMCVGIVVRTHTENDGSNSRANFWSPTSLE